jgi:hypothetical protein
LNQGYRGRHVDPGSSVLGNVRAILLIIQDVGRIASAPRLHIVYLEPALT